MTLAFSIECSDNISPRLEFQHNFRWLCWIEKRSKGWIKVFCGSQDLLDTEIAFSFDFVVVLKPIGKSKNITESRSIIAFRLSINDHSFTKWDGHFLLTSFVSTFIYINDGLIISSVCIFIDGMIKWLTRYWVLWCWSLMSPWDLLGHVESRFHIFLNCVYTISDLENIRCEIWVFWQIIDVKWFWTNHGNS